MSRNPSAASAHAVLDYILTRAVLQGKTGTTEVYISFKDLLQGDEGQLPSNEPDDLLLKIMIKTDWAEGEEDLILTDDEEGDDNGSGEAPSSDKTGH